jgi:hypothetical protein
MERQEYAVPSATAAASIPASPTAASARGLPRMAVVD